MSATRSISVPQRSLLLLALVISVATPARFDGLGAPALAQAAQHTALWLPFEGTWIVSQGYHGTESHHGYAAYALDFVKVDAQGSGHARSGQRTRDWYGFGAEVLAAADGVVVRAVDRIPDNRVLAKATKTNTVIVEHGESEWSEYVHLQHGSLRVRVGQPVRRGQVLARCGNSGAETPHLHWAFLSSMDPIQTRPATFSSYEVRDADGAWQPATSTPRSGEMIRPAPRAL